MSSYYPDAQRRYNQSPKGRVRSARYRATSKNRSAWQRYNLSAKRHATDLRYRDTEPGQILRKLYDERPDVKLKKRLYMQEWRANVASRNLG